MKMRLSEIKSMYKDVGAERCNGLLLEVNRPAAKRNITESSVELVSKMIGSHKVITRKKLLKRLGISRTTVEYALRVLSLRDQIVRTRDMDQPGYPISYAIKDAA